MPTSRFLPRRAFVAGTLVSLAACASNNFAPATRVADGVTLKGARLQIYSFLDVREVELGPHMLDELDKQVVAALAKEGTTAQVLRFRQTETGRYFTASNTGMSIPVRQTIVGNLADEQAFGADYRMVVFPSNLRLSGAWHFYDIEWEIRDARTGKVVWSTVSHGKHMNAVKNDEDPAERAGNFVRGFIEGLRASKLE